MGCQSKLIQMIEFSLLTFSIPPITPGVSRRCPGQPLQVIPRKDIPDENVILQHIHGTFFFTRSTMETKHFFFQS